MKDVLVRGIQKFGDQNRGETEISLLFSFNKKLAMNASQVKVLHG